jgi:spore coat polysaccharide biosynthesis protein SpsF (cytidylyltransferase family)
MRRVLENKAEDDTEVWGGYFTQTGLFDVRTLEPLNPLHRRPDVRMTLDYPEDLRFFEAVFDALYVPGKIFTFDEIMNLLEERPEIASINQGVQKLYEQGLRAAAPVRLK